VLAKKKLERNKDEKTILFNKIPYLNSSLFEPTEIEQNMIFISNLDNDKTLPLLSSTVLKDQSGKKQIGKKNSIAYLLDFLNDYDYGSNAKDIYKSEQKTIITASVLGLIFEKINGYKDGSFFTPGFITMYMSRETVRKAIVQKFNEEKGWNCKNISDLKEDLRDERNESPKGRVIIRKEANEIINSLKIIDPAVGSGHFLVSVLNEIVCIKSELKILVDKNFEALEYTAEVINDELVIFDEEGDVFEYNINNKIGRLVQETFFHEKQTIIENCLFGVDININSVKICRLRLWIELLKNAYYNDENELVTLPNIDINIKCGNSLISRFDLKDDLKDTFKGKDVKYSFKEYKAAVEEYKNTKTKDQKHAVLKIINEVKNNFKSTLDNKFIKRFIKIQEEFISENERVNNLKKFEEKISKAEKDRLKKLKLKVEKAFLEKEKIINNVIYHNAFEWRFEFPEVLDDKGKYLGFDAVIGNPPYFGLGGDTIYKNDYFKNRFVTLKSGDIYALFCELSQNILKTNGYNFFIISNKWLRAGYGEPLRKYFTTKLNPIELIDFGQNLVFDSAIVHTCIIGTTKNENTNNIVAVRYKDDDNPENSPLENYLLENKVENLILTNEIWNIVSPKLLEIYSKTRKFKKLNEYDIEFRRGLLTGYNEAFIIDKEKREELVAKNSKNKEIIKPILRGRDTRRYYCNYNNFFIINAHNGLKSTDTPRIDIVIDYPLVYEHLLEYEENAKKRFDKGEHWTNLRNCAYLDEFEKPKIIFSEIVSEPQFYYDELNYYPEATVFFISGEKLKYLTALLNSKFVTFLFKNFYMGGDLVGKIRYKKIFLEEVPIPYPNNIDEKGVIDKVDKILSLKKENSEADTTVLEQEIDQMVYELYGLTEEEIAIIENSNIKNT
jgi:type II restriction/modification system DNA methylase subunit YeeA